MAVRKLPKSWFFDFTIPGFERQRQAGYRTKVEALLGEKRAREELGSRRRSAQLLALPMAAAVRQATCITNEAIQTTDRAWSLP